MHSDETLPFGADALDAICRHMNADHVADCLDIVRHLGPYPDASAARLGSLDAVGAGFLVTLPDGIATVHIPWRRPIRSRADVRHEFVAMCDDARSTTDSTRPRHTTPNQPAPTQPEGQPSA